MIRSLREKKGLTQQQLAERLGVSDKAVSKWETGRSYPDITLLEPIAGELGVSVAELLSGREIANANTGGNMLRSKLYACPVCGNIIHSTGAVNVSCCGITLPPLEAEPADESHGFRLETVEDETYVTIDHEMSKKHYISFMAYANGDHFELVKLYPEGNAEARFKIRGGGVLYSYCNKEGLNMYKIEAKKKWGYTPEYKEYDKRLQESGQEKMESYGKAFMNLFAKIGKLKELPPTDAAVQSCVEEIRNYITSHYYTCSKETLNGLGQMYVADERFRKSIDDAGGTGTAEFVQKAIQFYCS